MKSLSRNIWIVFILLALGCLVCFGNQDKPILSAAQKEAIQKEVKEQFRQLVSALNQKNSDAWAAFYSREGFVSAIAGTDYYASRSVWVDTITKYFSSRKSQKVDPREVRVTALAPTLALMTSEEKSEMQSEDGKILKSRHVFTLLWKKEPAGWKILHSHESWVEE
jgi:ketosteroid isomerase-like protein